MAGELTGDERLPVTGAVAVTIASVLLATG
jgi:hypothetical protein